MYRRPPKVAYSHLAGEIQDATIESKRRGCILIFIINQLSLLECPHPNTFVRFDTTYSIPANNIKT